MYNRTEEANCICTPTDAHVFVMKEEDAINLIKAWEKENKKMWCGIQKHTNIQLGERKKIPTRNLFYSWNKKCEAEKHKKFYGYWPQCKTHEHKIDEYKTETKIIRREVCSETKKMKNIEEITLI